MAEFTKEDMDHLKTVPNARMQELKLLLVGDGGTGKTTFVKRMMGQVFSPRYIPTLGVEACHVIDSERKIWYNVWDTAGQEKFSGSKDEYYLGADIAIIMYDVTNKLTSRSINNWIKDVSRICPNIPVIIIGNKNDVKCKVTIDNSILMSNKVFCGPETIFDMLNMFCKNPVLSDDKIAQLNDDIAKNSLIYQDNIVKLVSYTQSCNDSISIANLICQYSNEFCIDDDNAIVKMFESHDHILFLMITFHMRIETTHNVLDKLLSIENCVFQISYIRNKPIDADDKEIIEYIIRKSRARIYTTEKLSKFISENQPNDNMPDYLTKKIDDISKWPIGINMFGDLITWIKYFKNSDIQNDPLQLSIMTKCLNEIRNVFPEIDNILYA